VERRSGRLQKRSQSNKAIAKRHVSITILRSDRNAIAKVITKQESECEGDSAAIAKQESDRNSIAKAITKQESDCESDSAAIAKAIQKRLRSNCNAIAKCFRNRAAIAKRLQSDKAIAKAIVKQCKAVGRNSEANPERFQSDSVIAKSLRKDYIAIVVRT
jgi:hypothetical protein